MQQRTTGGILDLSDYSEMRRDQPGCRDKPSAKPAFQVAHRCARIHYECEPAQPQSHVPKQELRRRDNRLFTVFAYSNNMFRVPPEILTLSSAQLP